MLHDLVAAALAERRDQLHQLVQAHVAAEVARLVDAELELRSDGNGAAPPGQPLQIVAAERACRACQRVLPRLDFQPGRAVCRSCRRQQQREAEQRRRSSPEPAPEPDPPSPMPAGQPAAGRRRWGQPAWERAWREQRRQQIQVARASGVTLERRGSRTFTVVHLPSGYVPPGGS